MTRKEITAKLSTLVEALINPDNDPRNYTAREVTFDYGKQTQIRVDYMSFHPRNNTVSGIEQGYFFCYEIKSSVADFHSPNGHNFIGDYNYYVMPEEVFNEIRDEIPRTVGVYVPDTEFKTLKSVKMAKLSDRSRSIPEMLLMMYRSSNRDKLMAGISSDRLEQKPCSLCNFSETDSNTHYCGSSDKLILKSTDDGAFLELADSNHISGTAVNFCPKCGRPLDSVRRNMIQEMTMGCKCAT